MSITNKKVDALRRLLLGNLYQECKDNPQGVSKERLQEHLDKIKEEGCIGECSIEEFVNTCQLKSHYPTCVNTEYKGCIEGIGERSKGANKFYYEQYKRSKMIEDEPDTEEEEEEEGEMCNVCGLTGDDDIGMPVEEMSCSHYSHINCLLRIAQQKGRDNAECPECRRQFSLEEVPVPVRTIEQRQADSARRAQFNASQMGFNVRRDPEEETEEERINDGIIEGIELGAIDELLLENIREFYTIDINRRSLIEYIRKWLMSILGLIVHEENIDINKIKRLVDTIFQINITLSISNNRFIGRLTRVYSQGNRNKREALLYVIESITKHHIDRNEGLSYFIEVMIVNSSSELLERVFRVVEENNANERLKDSIIEAIEQLDPRRIGDELKNVIKEWFERHNYEVPSFDDAEKQLYEFILQNIRSNNFMFAEESVREFYERGYSVEEYIKNWIDAIFIEISSGSLDTDSINSLVDVIIDKNQYIIGSYNGELLWENIKRIMRLGPNQREQITHIIKTIVSIIIRYYPDEEDLGIILENTLDSPDILRVIMEESVGKEEVLRTHLRDVMHTITDNAVRNMIREWFSENDNSPQQRVRSTNKGKWFGKFKH